MVPHLTWFTAVNRTRPIRHHSPQRCKDLTSSALVPGIHPCYSGFQVQGAAISPVGMALFHELFYLSYPNIIAYFSSNCKSISEEFSIYSKFANNFSVFFFSKSTSVSCAVCKLFFNGEQTVVFCSSLTSTRRAGFDVASSHPDCQICDGGIIGLTGAM